MPKFVVRLHSDEREQLRRVVAVGNAAARKRLQAQVLLLTDAGSEGPARDDEEIAEALDVGLSTIHRVRQRCVEHGPEAAISPRPAPTRPHKVKLPPATEAHLIALACADPPVGRARWTIRLLADRLVELRHCSGVSEETVRKALKKTRSTSAT
jgi:hypothetical protein